MGGLMGMIYGGVCYVAFHAAFLYLVGFLTNFYVPKSIDGGAAGGTAVAVAVDLALIALFGLQHSVMARPAFKTWWTRIVPDTLERSTYVLATSLVLGVIYGLWQPLPHVVWHVDHAAARGMLWTLFALGNLVVVAATFMIDHFDLLGLRQVYLRWRGQRYSAPPFRVAWLYRVVRHPLYLGFFLVFWATPDMSVGHLLFAAGMSAYILVAVRYEERDLVTAFGDTYERYREAVPMVVPRIARKGCPFHAASKSARSH